MDHTSRRRLKTLRQIIREHGISHETLRDAIRSGELRAYRVGQARNSRIFIKPEDFDSYLERNRIRPDAP